MQMFYVPCATNDQARDITLALLDKKLITCANIFPEIKSLYSWEGKMVEDSECVLILKTSDHIPFETIEQNIRAVHSYKTPAIIRMPVDKVNEDYLNWIDSNTLRKTL